MLSFQNRTQTTLPWLTWLWFTPPSLILLPYTDLTPRDILCISLCFEWLLKKKTAAFDALWYGCFDYSHDNLAEATDSNGSLVAGSPNVKHRSKDCVYTANSTVGLISGSSFPFVSQLSVGFLLKTKQLTESARMVAVVFTAHYFSIMHVQVLCKSITLHVVLFSIAVKFNFYFSAQLIHELPAIVILYVISKICKVVK